MDPMRARETVMAKMVDTMWLRRKADQHWEMAGLARQDGDAVDEQRHTTLAREYEQRHTTLAREYEQRRSDLASTSVAVPEGELRRMWINQPSTLQPHHALHGQNVLAYREYGQTYRVYFLSGEIIDMQMLASTLSNGWVPGRRNGAL